MPHGPPAPLPTVHAPAEVFSGRTGVVTSFDEHVGTGTVTDDAAGCCWWFHCTRIADGARTIPVGAAVRFRSEPGPTGVEAVDVTQLADAIPG